MAGKAAATQSAAAFEFELFEGDPDHLRTVVATPNLISPWIDPATLKLRHRIGRGPFGDVWLATQHLFAEDYDEYHEVAIKMLHPIKEDLMKVVLDKLENLFSKCQGLKGVCWLHGISVISGKICIIMKFYEGSLGDKMAHLKGGKLSLRDILRYGIDLAQAILELHSKEILVLNLKPYNFLLDQNDEAILGDLGIPYLLLQIPLPSSDIARRLGTPNYMAPEQWQPEVRGPLSLETDSWGFGCSIVEMLTGVQPWCGKSVEEVHDSVVRKQEKPFIPSGLPPAVERVIIGCFAYDFRSRPSMKNILEAFKRFSSMSVFIDHGLLCRWRFHVINLGRIGFVSELYLKFLMIDLFAFEKDERDCSGLWAKNNISENAVYSDGGWTGLGSRTITDNFIVNGYSEWFLSKENFLVGDLVRSRKPPHSCKPENMDVPGGTVVGLERDSDQDGYVLVRVLGIHDPLRVHKYTLERVTSGLAAGDWVRLETEDRRNSRVGILHSISRDGSVDVGFIGMETLWKGSCTNLQMAESYCKGQFVRLKANVLSPRFEWPRKRGGAWATGRIWQVLPNGCLVVNFPGRLPIGDECSSFLADPAEVELVSFNTSPGLVKKYQHLEDFHWAVRPLLIALGLFSAMKFGIFVGKKIGIGRSKEKRGQSTMTQNESQRLDNQTAGNAAWLPQTVAVSSEKVLAQVMAGKFLPKS
ncbi:E3 ubiquitin-protein ligase KEG [Vitis vinifera]|uniref:E3 ubiquitin-protein ligase KEG n=1 Tax=Vitis vinifera TaxID=29760 RepID=A0A438FZ94_VITVI|nr:E3 ubiquitin-protein ligase KEG [Vitis vinifera]